MKRLKNVVFFVALALLMFVPANKVRAEIAGSGTCGDNIRWVCEGSKTDGYTLTLSGSGEMYNYDWKDTPWEENWKGEWGTTTGDIKKVIVGSGITSIGNNAFNYHTGIYSVSLPQGIRTIGNDAFADCWSLQSITIPQSCTRIGDSAFFKCKNLRSISFPSRLTSLEKSAFEGCTSLTDVVVPGNIKYVKKSAFAECDNLINVTLKEGVEYIGEFAFSGCENLTKVVIPKSVTEIGFASLTNWTPSYMKIYGYTGTAAEKYAKENKLSFVSMGTVVPQKITLNKTSVKMAAGATGTLRATISPSGVANKKITWSSSNSSVAAVSSSGKITAKTPGKAVITAKTSNGKTAKCTVTVVPKGTPITKLQSQRSHWLNIQWRADKTVSGYQVQYSTSSGFKNAKSFSVTKNGIRSYTRKDLTGGKRYYVRVRTYKIVSGKKYYSNWSGTKSTIVRK